MLGLFSGLKDFVPLGKKVKPDALDDEVGVSANRL